MKQIHVISGYKTGDLGTSIKLIVSGGLSDIGFSVKWHNHGDDTYKELHNKLVLCVLAPKRAGGVFKILPQDNNIIYWNLEPISGIEEKRIRYRNILSKLETYDNIKSIWLYDESQLDFFKSNKFKFVPIGYHKSLEFVSNTKSGAVFLGSDTQYRKNIFGSWKIPIHIQKGQLNSSIYSLPHYLIGIDITAGTDYRENYRWHRLMLYAAARNVILTTSDLDKYGFINGKHYFRCNMGQFVGKYKLLVENKMIAEEVSNNMYEHVNSRFLAADFFRAIEML